jgi:hypothetical protein
MRACVFKIRDIVRDILILTLVIRV